ncbi:MAG: DUF760 domain-containing protein [Candidatus Caenarcaniphilales bacterium]|nr:DUF760 domain-containing protein [Candidatus Caenarcaniphilales bacterium]
MFFFGNNKPLSDNDKNVDFHKFFGTRDKDDILMLAKEISVDAKQFFESSITGILGHLPAEFADTSVTFSKESLNQLLYSAMITGYMTKAVENRLELESLIKKNDKEVDQEKESERLPKFLHDLEDFEKKYKTEKDLGIDDIL